MDNYNNIMQEHRHQAYFLCRSVEYWGEERRNQVDVHV